LNTNRLFIIVLVLIFAAFGAGIVHLFLLRFEGGDVYPPYSSLRADPLGTKVYYESLEQIGVQVSRNLEPIGKLTGAPGKTFIFCGMGQNDHVPEAVANKLEALSSAGSRVVLTFDPRRSFFEKLQDQQMESEGGKLVSLGERWGCKFAFVPRKVSPSGQYESFLAEAASSDATLDPAVSWHSTLYFEADGRWKNRYIINDAARTTQRAVTIERDFGAGTLVLTSDSYFLSNEALRFERRLKLLEWLRGGNRHVVFDETHHGVETSPGIAALIGRYRLHGLIGSLLLLAALYVWKSSARFVPPWDDAEPAESSVGGRDAAAGLGNLLQRGIPPRELLKVCLSEWRKAAGGRQDLEAKARQAQALLSAPDSPAAADPVGTYRQVAQILNQNRGMTS